MAPCRLNSLDRLLYSVTVYFGCLTFIIGAMHITLTKMTLMVVVLAAAAAGARADCEACVAGKCHSRNSLIEGYHVSDQMAVDRHHDVLYVQLNSFMNTAFFLENMKIRLVQSLNTSGLTVDQEEHVLYTADHTNTVYKYEPGSNVTQEAIFNLTHSEADLLFYKDKLYYTRKCCKGLHFIKKDNSSWQLNFLNEYKITDFVVDADDKIYFVADSTIYMYEYDSTHAPEVVTRNKYVLSVDKYGVVYFVDASMNAIYKMDNATKQLVDYAAYQKGTVEKFVFDDDNNIVFHDSADGSVNLWKPEDTNCTIEPPRGKYLIKISSSDARNQTQMHLTTSSLSALVRGAF